MCKTLILIAHLLSVHGGEREYNNENYGVGAECRGELFTVQAGTYRNSFEDTTVYVVGGIEPLRVQRGNAEFGLGIAAGPASGYSKHIALPVIGGVRARASFGRFEVSALLLPKLGAGDAFAHLMIGVQL